MVAIGAGMATAGEPQPTSAPQLWPGFRAATLASSDGTTVPYAVFIPQAYDESRAWPLVLFLHGSGESGTDGVRQTKVGLGPFIERYRKFCPFIAVFPQSPNMRTWFRGEQARTVFEILDQVQREYRVDPDRVYLTGISMGGFGTWEMAMMRPDLFAAIVPICGGGPVEGAATLKEMPIWCFHGALDDRVPVNFSRKMIEAVRQAGGDPRYTEYPTLGHLCWDEAYATKGLFPWLLKQKRLPAPKRLQIELDRAWCPIPTRIRWVRIDAVAESGPIRLAAAMASPARIELLSDGITGLTLFPDPPADGDGRPVVVIWQGRVAYKGPWKAEIPLVTTTTRGLPTRPTAPSKGE